MILKSMSRKGSAKVHFPQLFDYINERAVPGYEAWHNFNGFQPDRSDVLRAFIDNGDLVRNSPRHNILYHEVISLQRERGDLDEHQLEALHDLAQQYLQERAPGQLAYGALHVDKDHHVHMHLMISSNDLGQERRVSLKKFEFLQIQKDLETYLQQKFPELGEREIYNKPWDRSLDRSDREQQMKARTGSKSKKDQLRDVLEAVFERAPDFQEAGRALSQMDIKLEERGKHLVAQQGGLRCRIKTLGLQDQYDDFLARLGRTPESNERQEDFEKEQTHKEGSQREQSAKSRTSEREREPEPEPEKTMDKQRETQSKKREPFVRSGSAIDETMQEVEQEVGEKIIENDPLSQLYDMWEQQKREREAREKGWERPGLERG